MTPKVTTGRTRVMNPDLAAAETLPSAWYLSDAIFAQERAQLFWKTWQLVAKQADLPEPGSFFTTELVGEPILLTRDLDGVVRGFFNVCRHRAGPVALGAGRRRALQCAYHGWIYSLDGRLVSAREMDGVAAFEKACLGLAPVRVAEWGPLIFVNLDPKAPPFADVFGPIMEDVARQGFSVDAMTLVEHRDYDVRCNWKVYVDNYLEGYHIPIVHPGLFRELDYDRYEVLTYTHYSKQLAPVRPPDSGASDRLYARFAESADAPPEALYYWVFPNLMLNIYPDNLSTNVILPTGLGRTLTVFEWFARQGFAASELAATIAFSDQIQQEDVAICEQVQKGLSSQSYDRGRYSVRRENGVHHFHLLLEQALRQDGDPSGDSEDAR